MTDEPVQGSPRRTLAQRKAEHTAGQGTRDFKVPGSDSDGAPPIYVSYRKPSLREFSEVLSDDADLAAMAGRRRRGKNRTVIDRQRDVLIKYCEGIYEVVDGEKVPPLPFQPTDPWPRFGAEIARALDVTDVTARETVSLLFSAAGKEGGLITHVEGLSDWIGYGDSDTAEAYEDDEAFTNG